jgi:diacylglycerol kinase (ATP)
MPLRQWIRSANFAIEGVLHAAKTQRHLRYHFYAAAAVLTFSFVVGVTRNEFLLIALAAIPVLVAEMLNTAIEYLVDILSPEHTVAARAAKDVAAGAVLITAFGAALIGYVVLFPYIERIAHAGIHITKHAPAEISLIALILVLIVVVLMKAYLGAGHPLSGGMPSGHTALAFSVWTSVTFATENVVASGLCLFLAVLIAKSRISCGIHRPAEVAVGALVGSAITAALFLVFS